HGPACAELDLETAGEFIALAPAVLDGLGIDLLGPEHLVRAKLAVRGTARTPPSDGRPGRLGRDALVDWQALVDDVPMSAADLARVEAAGSTLMRAGHRWVRIDPAGVRRARKLLDEQSASRSSVDAIGVLQLAAGDTGESTVPVELTTDEHLGA